jgi:hypothetical protein
MHSQREPILFAFLLEPGTHLRQRDRNAPHRARSKRRISGERSFDRQSGKKPQEKARRRPRVSAIERCGGAAK